MQLNRSKLMLACLIASTMAVSACSKTPDSKKDDTLTATAPATGAASNLTERDAKQRLIQTLQANFKNFVEAIHITKRTYCITPRTIIWR